MTMVALSEQRDASTSVEPASPPISTRAPRVAVPQLQQHQPHNPDSSSLGAFLRGAPPRSPMGTPSRKHPLPLHGTMGNPIQHGRARASSFTTSYNNPLLVPQSPPPSFAHGRSLSLSPQAMFREPHLAMPNMPFLNNLNSEPPRHSEAQKAMEAAIQAERTRAKAMEEEEANLGTDELRAVLKRERSRMSRMAADLARLKQVAVQCQAEAEIHEEGRINGLMRRLESLQIEKGRIINELEREEEMVRRKKRKAAQDASNSGCSKTYTCLFCFNIFLFQCFVSFCS